MFAGDDQVRDPGGPVLVRRRGDVDGWYEDGQQPGWQSREHDVSIWRANVPCYAYVDAARPTVRAATSSDEPRRDERHRESSTGGASAEEARPQEKVRNGSHPGRVRIARAFPFIFFRKRNAWRSMKKTTVTGAVTEV